LRREPLRADSCHAARFDISFHESFVLSLRRQRCYTLLYAILCCRRRRRGDYADASRQRFSIAAPRRLPRFSIAAAPPRRRFMLPLAAAIFAAPPLPSALPPPVHAATLRRFASRRLRRHTLP